MSSSENPDLYIEGGCQCGHLRYRVNRPPLTFYSCHCTHCQKQSSSAFGMSMWVDAAHFQFVDAKPSFFETRGDSGARKICAFCPQCGTRIYHRGGNAPSQQGSNEKDPIISLKGGTLDTIKTFQPVAHIWTRSALPWVKEILEQASPRIPCFDTEPTDPNALTELWQRAHRNL